MDISRLLNILVSRLFLLSNTFIVLALRINSVYLIGSYLAQPFANVGSYIVQVATDLRNVSANWENTFDYIETRLNQVVDLGQLKVYANQLIAFILNPIPIIFRTIRTLYPTLDRIFDDPLGYIRPYVISIVNELFGFIRDVKTLVLNSISEIIPDFNLLRFNPIRWVIERIRQYSSLVGRFIDDPDGFIRERLRAFFPDLFRFLDDPRGFILEKIVEGLELFGGRYLLRLAKIFESILSDLF